MNIQRKSIDSVVIAVLLILSSVYLFTRVDFSSVPAEDAAMLMRYAENFANGTGIVWNEGDKPVDGATDFLFMIVVGLLARLNLPIEVAVKTLVLSAHLLTIAMVYLVLRKLQGASIWIASFCALYLAVGPGQQFIAANFGTPFFALFATITWLLALLLMKQPDRRGLSLFFVVSAIITGLIRPEGVILAGFMLLSLVYANGLKACRTTVLSFLGVFFTVGGLYFLWRWHYFGYPLPNPFYKKGGGHLHLDGLRNSIYNTLQFCFPFLPAFILGFRSSETSKLTISNLIPVAGFAMSFVLISNEMNFLGRFQYAILPIVLISWFPLVKGIAAEWNLPRLGQLAVRPRTTVVILAAVVSLVVLKFHEGRSTAFTFFRDGRYDVACMLRDYHSKEYTIATTEAGLLPYYSKWRAIDCWGLNDQWIAHRGGITEEYLDKVKPHIIMFNASFSPLVPSQSAGPWYEMVRTLRNYAETHSYVLASAFGDSPHSNVHYYYVRDDFLESAEIIGRIRSMNYSWYKNGKRAINYAVLSLGGSSQADD